MRVCVCVLVHVYICVCVCRSPEKTRAFCVVDGFHRAGDQNPAQPRASKDAPSYPGMLPAEECGMIERGHHLVAVNGHSVLDLDFKEALQLVKRQFVASAETQRCSIRLTFRTRLPDGFQRARLHAGSLSSGDTNASFRSVLHQMGFSETSQNISEISQKYLRNTLQRHRPLAQVFVAVLGAARDQGHDHAGANGPRFRFDF